MVDKELKLEYEILEEIANSSTPIGANLLSLKIDSSQATIGRILLSLDHHGYLEKSSNKGRVITESGKNYLKTLYDILNKNQNTQELIRISTSTDKNLLLDVLYTRKILEKETTALTAKKITDEQIKELSAIIDKQEEEKTRGLLGEKEDLEFHCKIANISGNKVIEQILILILTQKNVYLDFSYIRQKVVVRSSNDHRNIIKAFEERNSELASEYMVKHIEMLIKDIDKYYK